MLTIAEIMLACEVLTGKTPSNELVNKLKERCDSVNELRHALLSSPAIRRHLASFASESIIIDVNLSRSNDIEIDVRASILKKLFSCVQSKWIYLGNAEPYWSVLAADDYRKSSFSQNKDKYMEEGRRDVERVFSFVKKYDININSMQSCLEIGTGTGRMTQWLSQMFPAIVSCDISPVHLNIAREHLYASSCKNVRLCHLSSLRSLMTLPKVDAAVSLLVLQHNPPPIIRFMVRQILRSVNRGGFICFQVVTIGKGYSFQAEKYIEQNGENNELEMHVLPQSYIFREIDAADCLCLEVHPDRYFGRPGWISNTFVVVKR